MFDRAENPFESQSLSSRIVDFSVNILDSGRCHRGDCFDSSRPKADDGKVRDFLTYSSRFRGVCVLAPYTEHLCSSLYESGIVSGDAPIC